MNIELPPQYDPKSVESAIYKKWLDARVFHATPDPADAPKRPAFSIVIPPPNVTGALHLGHAINGTIQDILTRYHRMKGDNTLWLPGIDHAGIATQAVVEKTIFEKEKKNRHDLGREELVRRIWEWKEQFGTRILSQLQSIGVSCDWDRTRFTLDEVCAKAVREAFFKMFKDGLIFRGKRLVNWDVHLQTAVADDEIYHETVRGQMTSIKYPVATERRSDAATEGKEEPREFLIVATTRPETMLGDTAVAVHPDDPRYQHLIGKHVILPLIGRRIPIIADGLLVDPKFGTGVVKVTPAHDPNDYATGQRHNLEQINLLTPDGKVNENGQSIAGGFDGKEYSYVGLKFATEARKRVLADLEGLGLIAEQKPHEHEVGHSDRSKTPIEPYLSDQWFVRMGDIAEPRPLGSDRVAPASQITPHSEAVAYFITFHTFATWLHGQEPGAVDPDHNAYGTPFVPPDPKLLEMKLAHLREPPLELTLAQRRSVLRTMQEVAAFRGWKIHAANIRSTHVHVVVSGPHAPERMMNDFKSWATRRMVEAELLPAGTKSWSRHGSTRYLWKTEDVASAVQYTLLSQGENASDTIAGPADQGSLDADATRSLPNGRGSETLASNGVTLANGQRVSGLAQAAMDAVTDGRVKITPERYAKGYLDWLGQKRDWCISRQLWWGHRIPVWSKRVAITPENRCNLLMGCLDFLDAGDPVMGWMMGLGGKDIDACIGTAAFQHVATGQTFRFVNGKGYLGSPHFGMPWITPSISGDFDVYVCVNASPRLEQLLSANGFTQDPDVLDTWFSSALWPLSTMGWPNSEPRPLGSDRVASAGEGSLPDGRGSDTSSERGANAPEQELLPTFYPTSVLSTARDILTLWVARMVMFGLYCRGDVPFHHVYVHPVIQDGEGKIMSKSKGNGVDPVDIIGSHGADALRFTLASLATETQDIRMPVVKDGKTGVNTSPKFDLGRNFANKIWNASRFILSNVSDGATERRSDEAASPIPPLLEDRWILSRLNATIATAEAAINAYHFADYAQALYQFFWTDLCDWYLEIAKGRIKNGDATVQSVLLHCIRTSLKLLHPMMPFITEEIWSKLPAEGGEMRNAKCEMRNDLLVTAAWPGCDASSHDAQAEAQIAAVQAITRTIRDVRNQYAIPPGKTLEVTIKPGSAALQAIITASRAIIEPLANATLVAVHAAAAKPANAATAVLPDAEVYVAGVIDKEAEAKKLTKRREELQKFIAGNTAKLANEGFTAKAPAKVVQGLRDQLAAQQTELAAVEKNLAELGVPR